VLSLFDGEKVKAKQIIAGSTHTMVVTTKGELLVYDLEFNVLPFDADQSPSCIDLDLIVTVNWDLVEN
jgi:hypothetical protein